MPGADVLGGIVASAVGEVAGGAAGSALMGNTSYPAGGGMPGLTNTKTGKSGIPSTVQMQTGPALQYFKQAADSYSTNAQQGLSYYNTALAVAQTQLSSAYTTANKTLAPLTNAGTEATNQYLRMLGLDAPSPTGDISSQVRSLGSQYGDLAGQIKDAEEIRDPAARAQAKAGIMANFQTALQGQQTSNEQARQDAIASLGGPGSYEDAKKLTDAAALANMPGNNNPNYALGSAHPQDGTKQAAINNQLDSMYGKNFTSDSLPKDVKAQYDAILAQNYDTNPNKYSDAQAFLLQYGQQKGYQSKVDAINNQYGNDKTYSSLNDLMSSYKSDYRENADYLGFTGDEAAKQLANTPGYQFSLNQGNENIQRSAAAAGMLNSGNTLKAMDDYSQGLAQQTYNTYMGQLLGIANTGNAATAQISQNQIGQGTNAANMTLGGGQTALSTYNNIGQSYNAAYTNQGSTYTQIQLANMAAQNAAITGQYNRDANAANTAMGISPGLAQVGMANQQSQQYAQGFAGQQSSGWPTYSNGGWKV